MIDASAVRDAVLADHAATVERVLDCADDVAAGWAEPPTDGRVVADATRRRLEAAAVLESLPALLETAVAAAGESLPARPVAAPPYVTVTSRGPVCRATLSTGRLVLVIRAFEVDRTRGVRYVRGPRDPAAALAVDRRE